MDVPTAEAFLARAKSALDMPTTYWLDFGAWGRGEPARTRPGTDIVPAQQLELLLQSPDPKRRSVGQQYVQGAAEAGIEVAAMPREACDCTNFLCWALGVARDSGPGIDATMRQHLFEPLFSTKDGGMGLGLKMSQSILEEFGGQLQIETPQTGASIAFVFPHGKPGPQTDSY